MRYEAGSIVEFKGSTGPDRARRQAQALGPERCERIGEHKLRLLAPCDMLLVALGDVLGGTPSAPAPAGAAPTTLPFTQPGRAA